MGALQKETNRYAALEPCFFGTKEAKKNLGWQWQLGGLACLCKLCKSLCFIETCACTAAAWLKVNLTVWFLQGPGKEVNQPPQKGSGLEKGFIVFIKRKGAAGAGNSAPKHTLLRVTPTVPNYFVFCHGF